MAAGLGFKTFATGDVLSAADVNGYLMQGVLVFASAAARDAAITSPQEGQFAYLKDTNVTTYYTGSAWTNLDTTGMVNPMTTTGDTIYSSSGSTPARLGIGSTGNVLTVSGGVPVWAAPAGGGKVKQVVHAGTSTELYLDTNTETDTGLTGTITPTSATSTILVFASISGLNNSCNNDTSTYGALKLYRGASMIKQMENRSPQSAVAVTMGSSAVSYLDSPATTSATTYKVTAQRSSGTSVLRFQHNGNTYSSITLMEIGA